MTQPPITLTAHGTITLAASDGDERTLTGQIVSFDRPTDDRRGLIIRAGALTPRMPLVKTKLLRDHNMADPVGYMIEISDDRLTAKFFIPEGENGDRALAEARNHLRDGFSIGFTIEEYLFDDDGNLVVLKATIYEVSLCAVPAFTDAGILAALAFNDAGILAFTPERNTMPEIANPAPELTTDPAPAPVGELAGTPEPLAPRTPTVHAATRGVTLRELAGTVSDAIARGDHNAVRLALQDTVPADDKGQGFLRDDWRGELWQADRTDRPMIEALGTPKDLQTGTKIKGWAWDVKPDVQTYTGNKTAIASNKPKTKPVEAPVHRSAGGWDIDRIFLDLGEAGFLESFWNAAVADYKADSETYASEQLVAGAFEMPTQTELLLGLGKVAAGFAKIGAKLDAIFIAPDLFEEYAQLKQSEVPFWLANSTGVSLRNQEATVADLNIRTHTSLAAGQILAFDSRAATWFEKQPPIRVNAVDLPKGGIDLGLFGYDGLLVNDARALVKMQIGAGE